MTIIHRTLRRTIFGRAAGVVFFAAILFPGLADDKQVLILVGSVGEPYRIVHERIELYLTTQSGDIQIESMALNGGQSEIDELLRTITRYDPDLTVTLGSPATRFAIQHLENAPIVAGMILSPELVANHDNITAVILDHPINEQMKGINDVLPGVRKVGVLYNAPQNKKKVDVATAAAAINDVELVAVEVNAPKDLPSALKGVLRRVDALWIIPDAIVVSPQTTKTLLLSSFRRRVPVIGLSDAWVKAGALYALERDYFDLGRQIGHMAMRILNGTPVNKISVEFPAKVEYVVNRKTAEHMKLKIPSDIISKAIKIY